MNRKAVVVVVGIVLVVAGLAITTLAGREVADTLSRRGGTRAPGFVTDKTMSTRVVRGVSVPTYGIRYRFEVNSVEYTAGDATGRTDLAVGIPKELWDTIQVGDSVDVLYDRTDPANNRPAAETGSLGDPVAGVVLGLLLLGCGSVALLAARGATVPAAPVHPAATVEPPVARNVTVVGPETAPPEVERSVPFLDRADPDAVALALLEGRAHLHGGQTSDEGWTVRYVDGKFVRTSWRGVVESSEVIDGTEVRRLLKAHGASIVVPDYLD
ncbi:MAG: DUF3592 domain-containing protein [Actinomycetes bacterium]